MEPENFKEGTATAVGPEGFGAGNQDLPEVWEHSIASHSRFVAIDAGLAVLHGTRKQSELPHVSEALVSVSPLVEVSQNRETCTANQRDHELSAPSCRKHQATERSAAAHPPHTSPLPASERSSSTSVASPNFRLTDQLDKDKAAAFRKALGTANGLPADLRDDLCALLEESVEIVEPSAMPSMPSAPAAAQGNRFTAGRPPAGKGDAKPERGEGIPFPSGPQRPHASRARSSTPGAELYTTPRRHSRESRRAHSAAEASRREDSAWRRSEALTAAAAGIVGGAG